MLDDDSPLWESVNEVRDILAEMTPEERVEFLSAIAEGYCVHCGSGGGGHCHCQNDE